MKIALIGNFQVPYTTENDLAWSLGDLGHEVSTMQEQNWLTQDILQAVTERGMELVIYVHTHGWETPGELSLDELWQQLKKHGVPTASFHLDYWRGLEREVDVGAHPFWRTQFVFTADGGSDDWYRQKGINHFWLPPGVVKRDCYYARPREHFYHDVIFVGTKNYHPEWPYRTQLVDWLHNTYGDRFAHYGNDGREVVRGHALNELYASARVVVGDSINLGFDHPDYWSDRVPETLGRGGFLVHPKVRGMDRYFKDKKHLVLYDYNDFDGLKAHIDHYIANYEERERIRLEGHSLVKGKHTYSNRMEYMLNKIEQERDKPK